MISTLMLLALTLPTPGTEDVGETESRPSLELLEYIGAMEEDDNGSLIDPLDLPAAKQPMSPQPVDPNNYVPSAQEKLSTP